MERNKRRRISSSPVIGSDRNVSFFLNHLVTLFLLHVHLFGRRVVLINEREKNRAINANTIRAHGICRSLNTKGERWKEK